MKSKPFEGFDIFITDARKSPRFRALYSQVFLPRIPRDQVPHVGYVSDVAIEIPARPVAEEPPRPLDWKAKPPPEDTSKRSPVRCLACCAHKMNVSPVSLSVAALHHHPWRVDGTAAAKKSPLPLGGVENSLQRDPEPPHPGFVIFSTEASSRKGDAYFVEPFEVEVGKLIVQDATVALRDDCTTPRAQLLLAVRPSPRSLIFDPVAVSTSSDRCSIVDMH